MKAADQRKLMKKVLLLLCKRQESVLFKLRKMKNLRAALHVRWHFRMGYEMASEKEREVGGGSRMVTEVRLTLSAVSVNINGGIH